MTLRLPELGPAQSWERAQRIQAAERLIAKIRLNPFAERTTTFRLAALLNAEIEAFRAEGVPEIMVLREFCLAIHSTVSEVRHFLFIHGLIEQR
jgi:hypothetical protein